MTASSEKSTETILTLSCPDAPGIVAAVAGYLFERGCNITESAQFCDDDSRRFFMRVVFTHGANDTVQSLSGGFGAVANRLRMRWEMRDSANRARVLILVSRFGHCLNDLLFRRSTGHLPIEIPAIVSNHTDFEPLAKNYKIPFFHLPITAQNKTEQETRLSRLIERERIDLVVLARYMQILSPELCGKLEGRAINIHHSFLPSFKGARPYEQAHQRGVKLIGATAHYVTSNLDEGPIIEQDVARADHAMTTPDLAAIGHDIESLVLARAVRWHVERRVLLNGDRTVIFK